MHKKLKFYKRLTKFHFDLKIWQQEKKKKKLVIPIEDTK